MGFYGKYEKDYIKKESKSSIPVEEEYTGLSTTAKINIGVCAGYNNSNEEVDNFESYLYQKLEKISEELGFFISFIVYETKTIYKKEWGCPEGGEKTYNLETTRNPMFEGNDSVWRDQVIQIIRILKKKI